MSVATDSQVRSSAQSTVVAVRDGNVAPVATSRGQLTQEQKDLVKRTVAKDSTDDELALFLYQAVRTGLDPLSRQIHFVKRWDSDQGRMVGAVQTGIDGFRLIAARTGRYRPDDEAPKYELDEQGNLLAATVKVWIFYDATKEWYPVPAVAYYSEYAQTRKDGQPTRAWSKMRRIMLAKCAEALAIRKAFPAELSGIYAFEEFGRSDADEPEETTNIPEETTSDRNGPGVSADKPATIEQRKLMHVIWKTTHKLGELRFKAWLLHEHKTMETKALSFEQAKEIIKYLQGVKTETLQDLLRSVPELPEEKALREAREAEVAAAAGSATTA